MYSIKLYDTKLICISIHQQKTIKRGNEENSIHSNIKKNKILRNKLNQGRKRSVHWQLQNVENKGTKKWKDILCSWIRWLDTVKMVILPKVTCKFNAVPVKIPVIIFTEIDRMNLNFIWNAKGPWIAKTILRKNKKLKGPTLADFKTLQSYSNQRVGYWHKDKYIDQQYRIERLGINPHIYGQMIFTNGDSLFNKWWLENWISTCKRMKLDPYLIPYTKNNSKCIKRLKDLNIRPELKTPRRKHGRKKYITLVLAMTSCQEAQATKASIDR